MKKSKYAHVPCSTEVPDAYAEKARYALRMLLLPFRAEPVFVEPRNLTGGGIYYGTRPDEAPESAWRIGLLDSTVDFFSRRDAGPAERTEVTLEDGAVPTFFSAEGDAPFDAAAATFYCLSGWQEAYTRERDEHGRYPFSASFQHRFGIDSVPVVDRIRAYVCTELARRGQHLEHREWGGRAWAFCPTHDIDYIRKWRPGIVYREIVERALLNAEGESMRARLNRVWRAVAGVASPGDPYRTSMERLASGVKAVGGRSTFFIKAAARGPKDVHYDLESRFLRKKYLDFSTGGFEIALHPSYHAFNHGRYLREERAALGLASGSAVDSVRTHYLRFDPVASPPLLREAGFRIDSSLAFAEHEGFRRGTCKPFPLYDLEADVPLELWEMPLCVMESTLFNYRALDRQAAEDRTRSLMETCRAHDGIFVALWHNILWDDPDFPGWADHFTSTVERAAHQDALTTSLSHALDSWE